MPVAWVPAGRTPSSSPSSVPASATANGDGSEGVLVVATTSEDPHGRDMLFAVALAGGTPVPLFDSELDAINYEVGGKGLLLGRHMYDPVVASRWKGYRGGKSGFVWVDREGNGEPKRLPLRDETAGSSEDLNVSCAMWIQDRIWFVADPDGSANLWSVDLDGQGLMKHSQHAFFDVRNAKVGAGSIVYTVGGELYILEAAAAAAITKAAPRRIPVEFGATLAHLPQFLDAEEHCEAVLLHPDGHHCAVSCRGRAFEMALWEGPAVAARSAGPDPGRAVRCLAMEYLYSGRLVTVTDELMPVLSFTIHPAPCLVDGERPTKAQDWLSLLIADAGVGTQHMRLEQPIGKILDMVCSPAHDALVVTTNRNELWLIEFQPSVGGRPSPQEEPVANADVPLTVEAKLLDKSEHEEGLFDPCWSSDGEWVAYVRKDSKRGSSIVLLKIASGEKTEVSDSGFSNYGPCFSADGRFLSFMSSRSFAPFEDEVTSELTFACGSTMPYLVLLQEDALNPFQRSALSPAEMRDREDGAGDNADGGDEEERDEDEEEDIEEKFQPPEQINIDIGGIGRRILQFPLPIGRYCNGSWTDGGKFQYLRGYGVAHQPGMHGDDPEEDGPCALFAFSFQRLKEEKLADGVQDYELSMDLRNMVLSCREPGPDGEEEWRVHVAGEKLPGGDDDEGPPDADLDSPGPESGILDIKRVSLEVVPRLEWAQVFEESCAHVAEMYFDDEHGGVDWSATCARYREELLPRVRSRIELTDLVTELLAELGISHCSFSDPTDAECDEDGGGGGASFFGAQGQLGLRASWQAIEGAGAWRVEQLTKGDTWDARYSGPLARPGVGITEGAFIIAVNRTKVCAEVSLEQMLANSSGAEVLLTYVPPQNAARYAQVQGMLHRSGGVDGLRKLVASQRKSLEGKGAQDRKKGKKKKEKGKKARKGPEAIQAEADKQLAQMLRGMSIDVSEGPIWRTVRVKAVGLETKRNASLRDMVEDRSEIVHSLTKGRVGYVHVPDTCELGFAEFYRYYGRESEREALIVDLRCNGGGYATELLLKQLRNPPLGFNMLRPGRGKLQVSPEMSTPGHLVLLIDENTSSDGEVWAEAFKRFGMGKVVGVRTWGGVVSVGGADLETIDGGELSIPYQHYYTPGGGGYFLENHGADPDVEIHWPPAPLAGAADGERRRPDPQLAEAMRIAEELLAQSKTAPPEIPKFPLSRLHRRHKG